MAENTSRPCSSVPSVKGGCPSADQIGGMWLFKRSSWLGSKGFCGASSGARMAPSRMTRITAVEIMASLEFRKLWTRSLSRARASRESGRAGAGLGAAWASVGASACAMLVLSGSPGREAEPRVDDCVQDVDHEIDRDEDEGDEQEVRRHDRDIDVLDGLQEQQPHAGPLEHRLRDDREGDDGAELKPGD